MRLLFDGSVCFDRFGACFDYYTQLAPRLVSRGWDVSFTPSPTGVLGGLSAGGAKVSQDVIPKAPRFLKGPARRLLSKMKQGAEARWLRLRFGSDAPLFQSFYYGVPPDPRWSSLAMVLDLIPERFPNWYASQSDEALRARKADCIQRASRLICISQATRRDLLERYPDLEGKVDVVYLGIDPAPFQVPSPIGEGRPYYLQVGGRQKHKNFAKLLRAFAMTRQSDCDLVCAGENWEAAEWEAIGKLGLAGRVRLVHRPRPEQLVALYQQASALVYPSIHEGFGLPPLEAMAAGIPVAASNGGSLPEVVGDAALQFDPRSPEEMALVMERILQTGIRRDLVQKGFRRLEQFTWDRVAIETEKVYRKLGDQNAERENRSSEWSQSWPWAWNR